mmetsp:Transcript_29856/g.91426  ORF Transcript_29856/g.91426 Transcript_29856/m.91426 type:complete len:204 (-) Transcript_29856:595-1206(-)
MVSWFVRLLIRADDSHVAHRSDASQTVWFPFPLWLFVCTTSVADDDNIVAFRLSKQETQKTTMNSRKRPVCGVGYGSSGDSQVLAKFYTTTRRRRRWGHRQCSLGPHLVLRRPGHFLRRRRRRGAGARRCRRRKDRSRFSHRQGATARAAGSFQRRRQEKKKNHHRKRKGGQNWPRKRRLSPGSRRGGRGGRRRRCGPCRRGT